MKDMQSVPIREFRPISYRFKKYSASEDSSQAKEKSTIDIFLYYPNLIGYGRIIFMLTSFYLAMRNWKMTVIFYLMAFAGDAIDGYVARKFKQTSTFGGVLDMVTDRVSTCGLLVILSHLYPSYLVTFVMLIVLDISSHWFHVMSVSGHHKAKDVLENRNFILKSYYAIYPLFGYCCVGTEVFFVLLYVLHHFETPWLKVACFYGCFPACVLKQIINLAQLQSAMENIALVDVKLINEDSKTS